MKRLILSLIVGIFALAVAGGGAYYWNQQSLYVQTDNAQVKADLVPITAMAVGKLKEWSVNTGDSIQQNGLLGKEEVHTPVTVPTPDEKATLSSSIVDITSPISGVVLKSNVVPGQVVTPGQPIAMIADLSKAYVLAYIDESDIHDVEIGKEVDIYLDADPNKVWKGTVSEIGKSAGNTLSSGASSTLTKKKDNKEVQRVPVKITFNDLSGTQMKLGLNATVKIHK
ncbi:efflux RND transporter periplasmic adaptor subunit [Thermoflavimicrobium dichotomicum]|uniref:Barrel-sandwich domain of CusB or HlyD membrane-fusion n=1 Tax=Thermoflavimicrobium dichotomicum TaxID=46223 RepID=A0A1I3KIR2_9BACL|nr:efflux RND transporter periplasmic adaptor subunit [Thermoflavimicrobium dichotomicum]SFI72304.1 Barrel-sandwich domain of CusB or HlyD membrane-fusion [Thermoflavimicrobium dichotomicum]